MAFLVTLRLPCGDDGLPIEPDVPLKSLPPGYHFGAKPLDFVCHFINQFDATPVVWTPVFRASRGVIDDCAYPVPVVHNWPFVFSRLIQKRVASNVVQRVNVWVGLSFDHSSDLKKRRPQPLYPHTHLLARSLRPVTFSSDRGKRVVIDLWSAHQFSTVMKPAACTKPS